MRVRHLAAAALMFAGGAAQAQDIQNFKPAIGAWNYFTVEGGGVGPTGVFVPSLMVNYGVNPLVRRDENNEIIESIVESLTTIDAIGSYAINDWIEVGLDVPLHIVGGGDGLSSVQGQDGFALGDIRLLPKVALPGGFTGPVKLAAGIDLRLPTGNVDKFVSSDALVVTPEAMAEIELGIFRAAANFGIRYRSSNQKTENLEVGNEFVYGAGIGVDVYKNDVRLLGEAYGSQPVENVKDEGAAKPLEALFGARVFTSWCGVFTVGGGIGVVPDYGSPDFRVVGGLTWLCREGDRDRDGILDAVDSCPDDPEDKDDFEDVEGCPDPDNDKDTILDVGDDCPLDPEDLDGFEDEKGCPDPDNDQDQILDKQDQCPNDPEDRDTFEDENGCPDPDNDQDQILDVSDACPLDPEDKDGFEDENGCPDPDNDQDGILDGDDKCPLVPEVINGVEDEDGCPDEGASKVQVTQEKIEILDRVFFDLDKATIKPISFDVLNQVASILKANQQITKVRIEGHTDRFGGPKTNRALSQARASSVLKYLVGRGVDAARLEAKGYGSDRPLVPHKQRGSPAKNRRVEFVILEQVGKGEVKGTKELPAPAAVPGADEDEPKDEPKDEAQE